MCGINGILRLRPDAPPISRDELLRTREHMQARGPDGAGEWFSPNGEIALAHRRLAIIDLSSAGSQPMSWAGGRYWIVFNGEIYNYRELRSELERDGAVFRSTSDTEVVLALYERQRERMFPRLRGMYALALWDDLEHQLVLARDPYGIKPLYYSVAGDLLRFASQVKALEAGGAVSMAVDPAGLVGFLLWGSVPEPFTIREAVRALPAGAFLVVRGGVAGTPEQHYRFDAEPVPPETDVPAAVEASIRAHLVADVPVGIFLSAGLDSAMIAAVAVRALPEPPTTVTVRFESLLGSAADEGPLAAETARALGTNHIEHTVCRGDFLDLWPRALAAMDQPSIDGFNTYVVSQIAAQHGLKVILSGLGGDELLGGYPSFRQVPRWARITRSARRVPWLSQFWPPVARRLAPTKPKLAGSFAFGGLSGAYLLRRGLFLPAEVPTLVSTDLAQEGLRHYDPVQDAAKFLAAEDAGKGRCDFPGWLGVHVMESTQYMRNQLLRDCDWASMAHSLELRVPFVDARLRGTVAAADYEPARSEGKSVLAQGMAPALPSSVLSRAKTGFNIPVMDWFSSGGASRPHSAGLASRSLALSVLQAFGIDAGMPSPPASPPAVQVS